MKRIIPTAVAAGLVGAGVLLGPAAHAITNPADNPRPITVKGDDGKTYHDGEDTLPGYDDEACTYIPGAWFDFENNRVRYADGQSIPWTEWDRATGYKEWLAKKAKGSQGGSTPSAKPSATPKSSGGTTKSSTTKSSTTKTSKGSTTKSTTKTQTPVVSQTQAATPTATEAAPAASADGTKKAAKAGKAKAKAKAAAATTTESAAEPVEAAAPQTDVVEATAAKSTQDTSSAGLLILGGLGSAGLIVFAGYSLLGRRRKGAAS